MKEHTCDLVQDCEADECGTDVYFIKGAIEAFNMDMYTPGWTFPKHRIFECNLSFEEHDYDDKKVAEELHNAILENSVDAKVNLVAMSYGGFIAQRYAIEHPEKVDKIILLNSFSKIHQNTEDITATLNIITPFFYLPRFFGKNGLGKIKEIDLLEESKKIKAKAFIYNCELDKYLGEPPRIKNAQVVKDSFCNHWTNLFIPAGRMNYLAEKFLDSK